MYRKIVKSASFSKDMTKISEGVAREQGLNYEHYKETRKTMTVLKKKI